MAEAFSCDGTRTPIGRYGVRCRESEPTTSRRSRLGRSIVRNPSIDWSRVNDVIFGCANQAGEANRNVARMAALFAGLPVDVAASPSTACAAPGWRPWCRRRGRSRPAKPTLVIAGGVECMSRAPFVMAKATSASKVVQRSALSTLSASTVYRGYHGYPA